MPEFTDKPTKKFPWITRIFIFLYGFLFLATLSLPFFYQQLPMIGNIGLERSMVLVPSVLLSLYFLIIAFSFFRAGDNWLIFSIILIFFSTLAAVGLAALGSINARHLLNSGVPNCINDINSCTAEDGIIIASGALLAIAIPTILFNILTFIAIMKSFGARDPYE